MGKRFLSVALVSLFLILPGAAFMQEREKVDWASFLPEGKGKELVTSLCVQCHNLQSTVIQRKDARGWQSTVNDMISRGAQIFPEEAEVITKYLAEALGPDKPVPEPLKKLPRAQKSLVDINSASAEGLMKLPGLSKEEAKEIIEYREKNGPFKSVEEIKKVKGIGEKKFEKIKDEITVKRERK